jgi:hypothetical protein
MRAAIRVWCLLLATAGNASADEAAKLATCTRCDSIEVRHRGTPYWEAAVGLVDGDWVRGAGGFKLVGSGGLELASSTTLFVEADGKRARISIIGGTATLQLTGGDAPVTLHTADGDVQIAAAKPTEVRLTPAKEGIAAVTVIKGELIVNAAGGVKKLGPTVAPPPPPQPPQPPPPTAIKVPPPPVKPDKIATPQAMQPKPDHHVRCLLLVEVALRWSPIAGATHYKLQVAKDMGFRVLVENRELKKTATSFAPPGPGIYAWRVAARDAKGYGDFSPPRRVFCDK